jgi:hypothetical protein
MILSVKSCFNAHLLTIKLRLECNKSPIFQPSGTTGNKNFLVGAKPPPAVGCVVASSLVHIGEMRGGRGRLRDERRKGGVPV